MEEERATRAATRAGPMEPEIGLIASTGFSPEHASLPSVAQDFLGRNVDMYRAVRACMMPCDATRRDEMRDVRRNARAF